VIALLPKRTAIFTTASRIIIVKNVGDNSSPSQNRFSFPTPKGSGYGNCFWRGYHYAAFAESRE